MKMLKFVSAIICTSFLASACGSKNSGGTTPITIDQKQQSDYLFSGDKDEFADLCSKYNKLTNDNRNAIEEKIKKIDSAMGIKLVNFISVEKKKLGGREFSSEEKKDIWNKIYIPYFNALVELINKVPVGDLKTRLLNEVELAKSIVKNQLDL